MSEIDWNVELRKAERAFEGLPPEPTPAELRARRAQEDLEQRRNEELSAAVGAYARLMLVASLAGALGFWPYARDCGPSLFAYMGAEGMLVAGGLWVAVCTWRNRMAKTHIVALAIVLGGVALLQMEVLPRIGYAKVDPAHPPQWRCGGPSAPRAVR
jgi:hypothetical protein